MRRCPALRALAAAPMTHMPSTPSPHPHHPFHLYSSAFPLRDPFHADLFSSAASFHQRLQLPPSPHTYHKINARKRRSRSPCRLPLSIPSSAHQPFAKKKKGHQFLSNLIIPSSPSIASPPNPPLHSVTFQDFIPHKKGWTDAAPSSTSPLFRTILRTKNVNHGVYWRSSPSNKRAL